jgi:hypothetical protein
MEVSLSGWALVVVAAFWAVLVGFLSFALISLFRALTATRDLLEDIRRQTTPLLRDLTQTVEGLNKELVRVDDILVNVQGTTAAIEGITKTAQNVVASPAVRALALAAGAARAYARFRKGREE